MMTIATPTETQTRKAAKELASMHDGQTWETTIMYDDNGNAGPEVEIVALHCLFSGSLMVDCLPEWAGYPVTDEDKADSEQTCGASEWVVARR